MDKKELIWVGTTQGLHKYDGKTIINVTEKILSQNEGIGCIVEDNNGTVWFNTYKHDIYSYNNKVFTKIESKKDEFNPYHYASTS